MSSLDATSLRARGLVLRALRNWMDDHGYVEVPTPVRVPSPAMEPTLYALTSEGAFLRTSPEFALKRVLAAGLPRIYEIGPCFRAEEKSPWHTTEFLMMEWYRAGASLTDLMEEVKAMIAAAAHAVGVQGPTGWRVATVRELFLEYTGLDLATSSAHDLSPEDEDNWDIAFFRRWVTDVEPNFTSPLFVTDWPASQAALAKVRSEKPWPTACRFEVFLGGVELANAFRELTDPVEQRARFAHARQEQAEQGDSLHPVDEAFIEAVGIMPSSSGIAMGVDRLVAALCGWDNIQQGQALHPSLP